MFSRMRFYGVINANLSEAVELYLTRAEAEDVLREVLEDEPHWAAILYVDEVELESGTWS